MFSISLPVAVNPATHLDILEIVVETHDKLAVCAEENVLLVDCVLDLGQRNGKSILSDRHQANTRNVKPKA